MTQPVRILFAHPALSIDEAETFVRAQFYNLPFELIYISVKSKNEIYYEGKPIANDIYKVSLLKRILGKLGKKIVIESRYTRNVRALAEFKADVILAQYGTVGTHLIDYAKDLNLKLVVHFHGFDSGMKNILARHNNFKELWNQADAVIAVSKKMKNDLRNLGAPDEILRFNCYGIDTTKFQLKQTYGGKDIIAVGRFTEKKAPQILVYAFSKVLESVPDARLIIAGDGVLYDPCVKLARAMKIEKSIVFLGRTTHEVVAEYMQNALMFVQHSIVPENGDTEGTPLAVMEAMCSGLPVVSTRHAGIMDVVADGITGFLVDENDADEMANHIVSLLENINKCREMGVAGRKYIENHNTLERYISDLERIILESLKLT